MVITRLGGAGLLLSMVFGSSVAGAQALDEVSHDPPRHKSPSHPDLQMAYRASAPWQEFVAENGPWMAEFDESTGLPRRAWGRGIAVCGPPASVASLPDDAIRSCLQDFFRRHPQLIGLDPAALTSGRVSRHGDVIRVSLQQTVGGIPVVDGRLEARFKQGKLVLFGVEVHPGATATSLRPSVTADSARTQVYMALGERLPRRARVDVAPILQILPLREGRFLRYHLVWTVEVGGVAPLHQWVSYVDAHSGQVLHQYDRVLSAAQNSMLLHSERRTVGDDLVTDPFVFGTVDFGAGPVEVGADGGFVVEDPAWGGAFTASTMGPYAALYSEDDHVPQDREFVIDPLGEVNVVDWTDATSPLSELSAWVAFHQVREYAARRAPDMGWLNEQVPLVVNADLDSGSACNAFFAGSSGIYMLVGLEDPFVCVNLARVKDVMYHEYGHGLHAGVLVAGTFDASVSEGSADYLAATMLDDPYLAPGAFGPGTVMRECDSDRKLPDDLNLDPHTSGLIWAGAMWDLRGLLIDKYGFEEGRALADTLLVDVLRGGPTLWDLYPETLLADDDDGDLANGTPHLCEILEAFGPHGLGDGDLGLFDWGLTPLADQSADAPYYRVEVKPQIFSKSCSSLDLNTLTLFYSTNGGAWTPLPMMPVDGQRFAGEIPRAPSGSTIRYDLQVWDRAQDSWTTYSGERSDLAPSFYVGPLTNLFCDDFETDLGWVAAVSHFSGNRYYDWQRGAPAGLSHDPAAAFSGSHIWGMNLGNEPPDTGWKEGEYHPGMTSTLSAPPISTLGYRQVRLNYQRVLSVEDGTMDHAEILVGESPVWANFATTSTMANAGAGTPTVDRGWYRHTLRLPGADNLEDVHLVFRMEADGGLQYGGWNIDDLCVQAPSDLDGRYRAHIDRLQWVALEGATLKITLPYIYPLTDIRVVRKAGAAPAHVGDGVTVYQKSEMQAGSQVVVVDTSPIHPDGTVYYYRAFTSDGETWWPQGEPGVETRSFGKEAADIPDEGENEPPAEPSGCNSQAQAGTTSWLGTMVLAGWVVWRRRRSL